MLPVPCGKCINCRSLRRLQWTFRISEEIKDSHYVAFATLTYDESHLPTIDICDVSDVPTLNYKDVQDFIKRFRFHLSKLSVSLRYFVCGEYGSNTLRPHYHCIFFFTSANRETVLNTCCLYPSLFRSCWSLGSVLDFQQLRSDGASGYCNKYLNKYYKVELLEDQAVEKSLKSQLIGRGYINRMKSWHKQDPQNRCFCQYGNIKVPMPRTFQQKIFDRKGKRSVIEARVLLEQSFQDELRKYNSAKQEYLRVHGNLDGFEDQFHPLQRLKNERDYEYILKKLQSKDKF